MDTRDKNTGTRSLLLAQPARAAGARSAAAAVREGAFRFACRVRKRPRCSGCSIAKTRTSGTGISGAARRMTSGWRRSWNWCGRSMTGAPTAIDWRVGRLRTLLPIAVHAVALAALHCELAGELADGVVTRRGRAGQRVRTELRAWLRERASRAHADAHPGRNRASTPPSIGRSRAWFGPGWTAVWLRAARRRRLLYVVRGELTAADHAALRRHLKTLQLE